MKSQIEIEEENLTDMITKATAEFNKSSEKGNLADFSLSNKIIPWYVGELAERLEVYKADSLNGKAKVKPIPAKVLLLLDSSVVAHYTVKCIVNSKKNDNIMSVASSLAKILDTEYKISHLDKADSEIKRKLIKYIDGTVYTGMRKIKITSDLIVKYHKQAVKDITINFTKLALMSIQTLSECQPIISEIISPPLFTLDKVGSTKDTNRTAITLLPWFKEWILNKIKSGELLTSFHTAMVEKPIDWSGLTGGGFYTSRFKYDLIKTRVPKDQYYGVDMSNTLNALNKIQGTKWRVNYEVLKVMKFAKDNNLAYGGLPINLTIDRMPYPHPNKKINELTEDQVSEVHKWRKHTNAQHNEKVAEDSKYMAMFRVVQEAERFQDYSELYFAYFLDFRGRIYPKASNFHPQGTDYIKSLLHFSEGKRIQTIDDEMFLAMQGANSFGIDKETFINKHKWVVEHEKEILDCASNPYDPSTIWHDCSEDPWQFLAFCFEWRDYRAYGDNFKSRLPVAMDGSCNGLQHLGAMFMDEVGGKSVNLTNNATKGDIYADVRDETVRLLKEDNTKLANSLLEFGITRKAVKRPVMIVPYAGTSRACRNYLRTEINSKGAESYFKDDYFDALVLYSDTVWKAIGNTILKGREAMEYLGKAASAIVKTNKAIDITWTTPNGFRVIQRKIKEKHLVIKTPLGERIGIKKYVSTRIKLDTANTNTIKHKSSIAPNLVHSLDSCHLQDTVNELGNGISFAMIHDSFGTHACDSRDMFKAIRSTFYNMYKDGDILDKFLIQQPDIDVEGKPSNGNLELIDVLKSEFFFS